MFIPSPSSDITRTKPIHFSGHYRILIAEDENVTQSLIEKQLKLAKPKSDDTVDIIKVASLEGAKDVLSDGDPFHGVITDNQMPEHELSNIAMKDQGLRLAEWIRDGLAESKKGFVFFMHSSPDNSSTVIAE